MNPVQIIYPAYHIDHSFQDLAVREEEVDIVEKLHLLLHLGNTNRMCSSLFAMFIPINTCLLNVFFPLTSNVALQSNHKTVLKAAFVFFSILADLATLVFRLITLLPRALYNHLRTNDQEVTKETRDKLFKQGVHLAKPSTAVSKKDIPIRISWMKNGKIQTLIYSRIPQHSYRVKKEFSKNVSYEITKVKKDKQEKLKFVFKHDEVHWYLYELGTSCKVKDRDKHFKSI